MAKKKEDPLSLAIRIILIILVVVGAGYFSFKVDGYKTKLRFENIEIKNDAQKAKQLELKFNQVNSNLNAELEAKESNSKRLEDLEQEKLRLEQELQKAQKDLQAKADAKAKQNTAYAAAEKPQPISDKAQLMTQAGIPESEWVYADWMIQHESGWRHTADNPSSSAYGLCQALPGSKMASMGADWKTNPITQLKWCHSYAHSRYGGWAKGKAHWLARVPIKGRDVGNWW